MTEVFGSAYIVKTPIGIEMLIWSAEGVAGKEKAKKFAEMQENIGWGETQLPDSEPSEDGEVTKLI